MPERLPAPVPVLLLVRELHVGGCERDMTRLAVHMDRSRFTPHVGCFRPSGIQRPELERAHVPVVQFHVPSFKSWAAVQAARELGRYVREHRIAVVHAFDVPTVLWAVPAARAHGVPLIVSSQLSYRSLDFYPPSHLKVLRLGDRWADHWMVNSRAVQEHLTRDENIPAERISVHYNGVDAAQFFPGERADNGAMMIGSVCALRAEKRIEWLIRAVAGMQERAVLTIVGDGTEKAALQKLAAELGLDESRCRFEPTTSDAGRWYRSFDVFCLTSSNESFPNALLEAMACGCAVVASEVGGVPELVGDKEDGLLFRAGDVEALSRHLDRLAGNREERLRLGKRAVEKARRYDAAGYCRGIEAMYSKELLQKGFELSDDRE